MFNAARLKKLRKDLGFTQQEMAEELHVQQSTYSKLETNNHDINCRILEVLQEKFKVDPKEFLKSTLCKQVKRVKKAIFLSRHFRRRGLKASCP